MHGWSPSFLLIRINNFCQAKTTLSVVCRLHFLCAGLFPIRIPAAETILSGNLPWRQCLSILNWVLPLNRDGVPVASDPCQPVYDLPG
jgi:hypothetical protein